MEVLTDETDVCREDIAPMLQLKAMCIVQG